MRRRPSVSRLFLLALAALVLTVSASADAQGKGKGHGKKGKKHVSTSEAVVVTRDVLVAHGFEVIRVERVETTQVIYYRRGNNGRGRGRGPVERMVIRPSGDVVVFESAPERAVVDIRVRLGL